MAEIIWFYALLWCISHRNRRFSATLKIEALCVVLSVFGALLMEKLGNHLFRRKNATPMVKLRRNRRQRSVRDQNGEPRARNDARGSNRGQGTMPAVQHAGIAR